MKHLSFLIVFASLMLFSFGLAHGVSEIVLDNDVPVTGYLGGDTVSAGSAVRWNFRFRFTDMADTTLSAFTNGFRVWTHSSGAYTDNFSAITYDTFPWDWEDIFDLVFAIKTFSIDGLGADSVSFGGNRLFNPGLPSGTDSLCWWIETTPTTDGDTLCIDSSFCPPGDEWIWVKKQGNITFVPDWGGPYCFHVHDTTAPVNNPPVLDAIGPKVVDEGQNLNFYVAASDPDGDAIALEVDTSFPGMIFTDHGNDTGTFDWTPGFDDSGLYLVTFIASDGKLADSETVEITVNNVNRPPEITPVDDTIITECDSLVLMFSASDPDGDAVAFDTDTLYDNMIFTDNGAGNALLTFYPDFTQADMYPLTLLATDGVDTTTEDFTITVDECYLLVVVPDTLKFTAIENGTDPDTQSFNVSEIGGGGITFNLSMSGTWYGLDRMGGGTPEDVVVSVNISGLTDSTYFDSVTVYSGEADNSPVYVHISLIVSPEENNPPVLDSIGPKVVDEGQSLNFYVAASDPDGDSIALEIDTLYDGMTFFDNGNDTGTFDWTPDFDQAGVYNVTFIASDGMLADSEVVGITVNNVNRPPEIEPVTDTTIGECDILELAISATDPDGNDITLEIDTLYVNMTFTDNGDGTADFYFDPSFEQAGTYPLIVFATDGDDTVAEGFTITVEECFNLVVIPDTLYFFADSGGTDPDTQSFNVSETGGSAIAFTLAETSSWFDLDKTGGTTPEDVEVSVNITGLSVATYFDSVTVSSGEADNSPQYAYILLEVTSAQILELEIEPDTLYFTAVEGGSNPDSQSFVVIEVGGGNIAFTLAETSAWFSLNKAGGTTPESVFVAVDISSLIAGDYFDSVMVSSGEAGNSTQFEYISLKVFECYPELPAPELVLEDCVEYYIDSGGNPYTRYRMNVLNWFEFPDELFEAAPDLPPCGLNDSASRTWVDIYDGDDNGIYGFCALGSATHLNSIWFACPRGQAPPDSVYITLTDRRCELVYTSNLAGTGDVGYPPHIECPPEPLEVTIDTSGEICVTLAIEGADSVYAEEATWFNNELCFMADTTGSYTFSVIAINACGIDTCDVTVVVTIEGGIIPTNEWINVYCDYAKLNCVPLVEGDVIMAYDPDGVLCGIDTVREGSAFGFMPIYRDDPFSVVDEGAEPGDVISFTINGEKVFTETPIVWTENGDIFELCIFTTEHCVEIFLHKGWNLISWNVTYSAHIDEIMAQLGRCNCVEVILSFDRGALTYDPYLPQFSTLLDVDYYHGYWFKMNCDVTLEVCGFPIDPMESIFIYSGWNLVSYWPDDTLSVEDGFDSILDNLLVALGYDYGGLTWLPGDRVFNTLTELKPLFGYWAKSAENDLLVYPGFIIPPVATAKDQDGSQIASIGIAPSRNWMSLYGSGITLDGVELASDATIEAYTHDGIRCGSAQYVNGLLKFTPIYGYDPLSEVSTGYPKDGDPVSLYVNGTRVYPDIEWAGLGSRVQLERVFSTSAGVGLVPDCYALMQNYPNPFNPTTEIAFTLPVAGRVNLEVYNVLGQRVATLAEGVLEAGEHVFQWDGTDEDGHAVSTGIYLYRLQAGDFVDAKKMVLMK